MRKKLARSGEILLYLLLAILVVFQANALLGEFRFPLLLVARGYSMSPALSRGDIAIVIPYPIARSVGYAPAAGDIICYQTKENVEPLAHRIVGGNLRAGYMTKGDANEVTDQEGLRRIPAVTDKDIIGVIPQVFGWPLAIPGVGEFLFLVNRWVDPTLRTWLSIGLFCTLIIWSLKGGISGLTTRKIRHKKERLRRRREKRSPGPPKLGEYAAVFCVLFILLYVFSASTSVLGEPINYEVLSEGEMPRGTVGFSYIPLGEERSVQLPVSNPTYIPLVVTLQILNDAYEEFGVDPGTVVLLPSKNATFEITCHAKKPGLRQVGVLLYFSPLYLPPDWINSLLLWNVALAPFLLPATPTALIVAGAYFTNKLRRSKR